MKKINFKKNKNIAATLILIALFFALTMNKSVCTAGGSEPASTIGGGAGPQKPDVLTFKGEDGKSIVGDLFNKNSGSSRNSIETYLGNAIRYFLGFVGLGMLLMYIYAGFLWMFPSSTDNTKTAAHIIKWTTIGLFVIFGSYAGIDFLLRVMGGG